MEKIRLRAVAQGDFRRNELTLYDEYQAEHGINLGARDAIMFVSTRGDQVVFVFRAVKLTEEGGKEYQITASRKLRMRAGRWHPWMLQEYAQALELDVGLKRFETYFQEARALKRQLAAERRGNGN